MLSIISFPDFRGVGCSGAEQHLFFATVAEADHLTNNSGNEHEGEIIEAVYLDIDKLDEVLHGSEAVPPIFSFGICWFLKYRSNI